jgi:hypothetical protein
MNRRIFLQKVSDLTKKSIAAIILSRVQIAIVAASIMSVSCTKENPVINNEYGKTTVVCANEDITNSAD